MGRAYHFYKMNLCGCLTLICVFWVRYLATEIDTVLFGRGILFTRYFYCGNLTKINQISTPRALALRHMCITL